MEAVSDILKSLDNELPTPEQIEVSKSQREVSKSTLLADVEDIENRHPEFQLTGCNNNDSGSTPLSKRACHSIQSQINSLANDLHSKLNLNTTPSSHNGNKRNFDLNLWTTPLHEHSFSSSFNNPDYGEDDLTDYNSAMFENDYSNFAEVVKANSKAAIRTFVGMTDLDDSREAVYNQYRVDLNGDRNDASSIRVFSSHNNVVGADYSFQRPSVTLSSGMVTSTPALMIHGGITEIESEDDISNVPGIQSSSCNNKNGESSNFTEKEAVIEEQENTKLYLSEVNNFSFNNSTNQILEDTVFFDTLDTSSVDVPPVNTVPNNTVMDSSTQAVGGNIEICGNTNEILNRSLKINENVENYATSESVFFKAEERGDKSVIEKSRLSFSFREDNEFNLRSVCETSKLFDAVIDCGSETDCAESIAEKVETTAVDIEPLSNRHSFGMSDKHGEQFAESTKLPVTSSRAEAKTVGDCAANEGSGTKSNCSDEGKNAEDLFCGNRESDEPNGNDWFSKSTIENEETRDESYFAKYLAAEEDITPESVTNEWNGKISAEKEDTKPSSEIDINDSVYDDASSDFEQTSAEVTQYENDLERDSSKMDRLNVAAPPVVDTSSANEQTEDVVCGLLATSFESTYEKKRMSTNSTRENIVVKDENFEHHQQYDAPEYTNIRRNQYSNGSLNIPADNDSGPNNSESTISPAGNENSVTRVVNDFDLATPTEIDFCNTNDSSSNELNKLNNMNNSNMEITKSPALYSKNHFDVENIDDQNETDEILTENESSKLHRRMDNSHIVEKLPAALSSYSESLCKETAAVITFREQVQNNYDATSDQNDNIQELPANVLDLESENGIVELSSDTVEDFKLNVENITNPHLDESQISRENSIVADSDSTKTGNRAIEDPNLTVPFDDFDTKVNFNHSEVDNTRVEIDLQNNDSPFASCDKSISDVPSEDINSKLNETVQEVLETDSHILKNSDLNNSHVSKRLTLSSEELCKETTDIVLNASIKSNCDATSDQNNDIHELRANVLELESENGTVELSSDTVEDFKLNAENITNTHLEESQISRENSIVADSDSTKTGNRAIEDPNLTVPFDDFDTKVNFNHSEVDNTRVEIDLQNNDSPFASCDKSISDVPLEYINSKLNETDKVQDGSNILRKIAKCKSKSVINAQSESTALEHALDGVAMDEKVLNHINKSALDFSNIQNGRQSEIENIVDQRSGGEENVNHAISEVKELIEEDPIRPDQSFAVINAEKSGEMQMETERDETRILLETCEIGETALAVNVNFLNNRNNSLHNTISECSPITVVQHEYYGMSEGKRICEDIATSEVLNKTTESSQQIKMDNLIRNSVLDISGNFRNDENVQAKLFDLLNSSGELIIDYSTRSSVVGVTDCEAVLEQATAGINSLELDYISDAEDNNLLKSEVCNDNDKAIVAKRGSDRYSQIADEQPIDLRNPPVTINKVETVNDGGVAEPDKTGAASLVVDDETGDASNCAKATKSDNENNADETVETIRRNSEDCDNSLTAENNADTSNRDVVNDFSANNVTSVHLNVANDSDNPLDVTVIEKEQNNANRSNTDKSRNRSVTETVDDLLLFDITPKIGYRRNRCSLINTPNCYSIMDMSPARFEHLQPRLLHEQPTPNLLDLSISKLESYNGCYSANENNSFSLMFSDDKLESGEKLLDISAVHVAGTPPVTFRTECLSVNEIQKKECSSVVIDYEGNRIGNATIKTNQECTDSSSNKSEDLSILRHTNDLISLMKLKQKEVENENHEFKKECTKQMDELKAQITTYEKKIDELITQSSRFQDDKDKLIKENEILKKLNEDLETSAKDAERRYLQGVEVNAALKQNEERMLETISNYQSVVEKLETKYKILKNHAHTELSKANTEIDYLISIKEKGEIKFNAQMSQMKVEIQSLRDTVKRLRDDNKQLQNICDDVINKFTVVPKH